MNRTASVLVIIIFFVGCRQPTLDLESARKAFADSSKKQNLRQVNWENTFDSLSKKSVDNPMAVILALTRMIQSGHYASEHVSDLYFLLGDIYYRTGSFRMAVNAYSAADPRGDGPKCLAARAGGYLKGKMPDSALADLNKAVGMNFDYKWNLGNYYEIMGEKDSAIVKYSSLYKEDSVVYAFCRQRIKTLEAKHPQLLTELIYNDRKRVVVMIR